MSILFPDPPDSNGAYLPTPEQIEIGKIIARERREAKRRMVANFRLGEGSRYMHGVGAIRELRSSLVGRVGWKHLVRRTAMSERCEKHNPSCTAVDDDYGECPACAMDIIIAEMCEDLQQLQQERDKALAEVERLKKGIAYWSYCTRQGMLTYCREESDQLRDFNRSCGVEPA